MVNMDRRTFGRSLLGLGFGAALMGTTSACTSAGTGSSGGGSTGSKTLTLAVDQEIASLDPAKQQSGSSVVQVWQACFDTLLRYEADGSISPNAAESFTFNKEKTELTLKLRQGMKFTDGTAVDAQAVKASLEHMKSGGGSDASRLAGVTVTVKDAATVVLTTQKPTGLLPTFLCLAPGILASTASLKASDRDTRPVGSGPYKLDAAATTSGSTYTFVRNPDYWNKAAYPYDKVVIRQMTDITARLNALKSGQVNAGLISSQTKTEAQSSGLTVLQNSVNWAGLFLSDQQGKVIPALKDVRVRRAINMVFDRPAILKSLFQGNGTATNQIFNNKSDAYLPGLLDYYAYDVAKAKALMKEAGYEKGFSFDLPAITGLDFANPIIVQQLALLNIKANQVKIAGNQVITALFSGKYPIFYFALESRSALWDIVQAVAPDAIWNLNKVSDPRLQPLVEKAQLLSGAAEKANARAINTFLVEQAWFCPWVLPANLYATDKSVTAQPFLGSAAPYVQSFKPAASA
ncbi:ABC transporter substrate-binding protein [Streptomyces sp. NPDC057253]|uniref:ABC transporter substrate-binding protein n=1 Tax=Streptomyces sp. NPDC057253 TaxID=3346069 RepID=UPI00364234D6